MPGAVFLRGDDVTLRTVEEEDVEFLRDTINDPDVRQGLTRATPLNAEQEREYFEEQISGHEDVNLAICVDPEAGDEAVAVENEAVAAENEEIATVDDEIAGTVGLHDLDQRSGNCEIGLWLATDYHGQGYGTEASRLLTDYAFRELRMHRVQARVLATNEASARIWKKLGFEAEGVHRDECFKDGEFVDVRYFGALAEEWSG